MGNTHPRTCRCMANDDTHTAIGCYNTGYYNNAPHPVQSVRVSYFVRFVQGL